MALYALDNIDDAITATREFLWPFDLGRWARLAVVVFFLGGFGGANPLQFTGGSGGDFSDSTGAPGVQDGLSSIGGPELAIIAAIIGIIAVLGFVFLLIGSIMEFVFVESLRQEAVSIRRYVGDHWGRGLRLFGFRLVLSVITIGAIGLLVVMSLAPILFGPGEPSIGLVLLAILLGIIVAIVSGLVHGFTTMFVVPVMMIEERGLLSAWRRFWPTMTGQWKQYLAYALLGFILQIAGGILATVVTGVAVVVVAIPLGLLGILGVGLLSVSELAGWAVIAIAVLVFVLAVIALVLLVSVPVQSYLRYYALLVLGDTNDAFDLISERRQAIRD